MTPVARFSIILCALIVSVAAWPAAEEPTLQSQATATILWPPPDPCVGTHVAFNPAPWPSLDLVVMGQPARLFEAGPSSNPGDPPRRHNPSERPLVLVVDGNGFNLTAYNDLAGYLAERVQRRRHRPASLNGPNPVQQATAAIAEAFDTLGLPDTAPVAVIGHSVVATSPSTPSCRTPPTLMVSTSVRWSCWHPRSATGRPRCSRRSTWVRCSPSTGRRTTTSADSTRR